MKTISFKASISERVHIRSIAHRAVKMAPYEFMDAVMDITACHANGCPLDLKKLKLADDFNFAHDIFGIRQNLNRETGQLENCFVPRFARKE